MHKPPWSGIREESSGIPAAEKDLELAERSMSSFQVGFFNVFRAFTFSSRPPPTILGF